MYSSFIHNPDDIMFDHMNNSKGFRVMVDFKITKRFDCLTEEKTNVLVEKFEKLQNEDFGAVLIPDFSFKVDGCIITQTMEFIKGYPIGSYAQPYCDLVYNDIVLRKNDWTFGDLNTFNYIVEHKRERIFAIDLQSYCHWPNVEERIQMWHKVRKADKKNFKLLAEGLGKEIVLDLN